MATTKPGDIGRLGSKLFHLQTSDSSEAAFQTALHFENWFAELGCPVCLEDLGVDRSAIPILATGSFDLARIWRLHRDYPPITVESILNCACRQATQ